MPPGGFLLSKDLDPHWDLVHSQLDRCALDHAWTCLGYPSRSFPGAREKRRDTRWRRYVFANTPLRTFTDLRSVQLGASVRDAFPWTDTSLTEQSRSHGAYMDESRSGRHRVLCNSSRREFAAAGSSS